MREFFKTELQRLHLTCGLQQCAKLTNEEFTELLDLLCAKCDQFYLIPDKVKQAYIQDCMQTDSEFIGFNAKILHKWLNILNRGYIHTQAEYQESKTAAPPYAEYLKQCEVNGMEPLSESEYDKPVDSERIGAFGRKIGDIAETFTQKLDRIERKDLRAIKCKHTGQRIPVSDTLEVCNDCGEEFEIAQPREPVVATQKIEK